jgi:RNA polymerase sigma-70 factor, ECF subfamily
MTSDDDRELIVAIRGGSEMAFNILIDRHQQAVRTFLRRLLGNDADADDMAQETFLAAWTHARSFRDEGDVRSWLCGIAWRKARGAQRLWFRRSARDTAHHEFSSGVAGSASSAGSSMEDRLAVRAALQTLPLEQRAALTLCLVNGFSHAEAAKILGAALGTVKSHVLRGRERLREAIERKT